MKIRSVVIGVFYLICSTVFAQELKWRAGLEYFFDNAEFAKSTLTRDYTVSGIHISPQIGVSWDEKHTIFGGVDVMSQSGSKNIIDQAKIIGYYQFSSDNIDFYAGAFPRGDLFNNYSELLFQDSINFFRPVIQGLYVKYGNQDGFISAWLDWNGLRTPQDRETFFIGLSGYKRWGLFYLDLQSYMFHFANTLPSNPTFGVCDNFQGELAAGIDFAPLVPLNKLTLSVGALAGFERDRNKIDQPHIPIGAVIKSDILYKRFGLNLLYYGGKQRMQLYDQYGSALYWGTPFLRSKHYFQAKIYIDVIRNRFINAQLGVKAHYSENKFFFEQQFSLCASLDNLSFKSKK